MASLCKILKLNPLTVPISPQMSAFSSATLVLLGRWKEMAGNAHVYNLSLYLGMGVGSQDLFYFLFKNKVFIFSFKNNNGQQ